MASIVNDTYEQKWNALKNTINEAIKKIDDKANSVHPTWKSEFVHKGNMLRAVLVDMDNIEKA